MTIPSWSPPVTPSRREKMLLKRLTRTRRLFAFLRLHRHELFNADFQNELAMMYRDTGSGKEPVPPALLAMATLLQAYTGTSDAEAVEMTVVDARWQMVLDVLGTEDPAFSQGALQAFRERLIAHELDRRLLERTVELARETKAFDFRKLPKQIRLAIDSRPVVGASRVEDTINLLGHAARKLLSCAAKLAHQDPKRLARRLRAPALVSSSTKRGLDVDWNDPVQKSEALQDLLEQIDALEQWVHERFEEGASEPPLSDWLNTLAELREQDIDPDPPGGRGPRIKRGVAKDRRISVEEPEMRHGRKSKSKAFNGYKSHLAADLDTDLVMACAVTAANAPEADATDNLVDDVQRYDARAAVGEMHIDLGYLPAERTHALAKDGTAIVCKARHLPILRGHFSKAQFKIDVRRHLVTCPAGETRPFQLGQVVAFGCETCGPCTLRDWCTESESRQGRTISIAHDEPLQQRLRKQAATRVGRARVRQRVAIEHRLAHVAQKQGPRARYRGIRKNLFDTRRYAAVLNLEVADRRLRNAA